MFVTVSQENLTIVKKNLLGYQKNGIGTDFKILCGPNTIFVHKIVMASASKTFEQLLFVNAIEFEIHERFSPVIEHLISICYSGETQMENDNPKARVS